MLYKNAQLVAVISITAVGFGSALILWLYQKKFSKRIFQLPDESKWHLIGTLAEINLFPVKSCAALTIQEANTCRYGIIWNGCSDRNLLILNGKDEVGFAGVYPELLSIKTDILSKNVMRLSAPNSKSLVLDMQDILSNGKIVEKQMKGYRMRLVECKAEHHSWVSQEILKKEHGFRLFIALDPIIETKSWWHKSTPEFFPIMVLHNKSLQDLNSRLAAHNQVNPLQFRGNLLVESSPDIKAYDEDKWLWLNIVGDKADGKGTVLRFNSPCVRCILPNIDVNTCQRNADFEPLKTLRSYRLNSHPKDPEMGVYFDVVQSGVVRKGDSVYVQYKPGK